MTDGHISQVQALCRACDDAIVVQNASNLSGVLASWTRHQSVIKDICGGNNVQYHQHPVNILFLSKVVSLMHVDVDCLGGIAGERGGKIVDLFGKSLLYCEEQRKL